MDIKTILLIVGVVLLVVGIAGNVFWTQKNKTMDKDKCFMINYWMYVGISGLGLLLAVVSGALFWWSGRGSSQVGYGLASGIGDFNY